MKGSLNFKLSAIKDHHASGPHVEAVEVQEYAIAKKQVCRYLIKSGTQKHQQILILWGDDSLKVVHKNTNIFWYCEGIPTNEW